MLDCLDLETCLVGITFLLTMLNRIILRVEMVLVVTLNIMSMMVMVDRNLNLMFHLNNRMVLEVVNMFLLLKVDLQCILMVNLLICQVEEQYTWMNQELNTIPMMMTMIMIAHLMPLEDTMKKEEEWT